MMSVAIWGGVGRSGSNGTVLWNATVKVSYLRFISQIRPRF